MRLISSLHIQVLGGRKDLVDFGKDLASFRGLGDFNKVSSVVPHRRLSVALHAYAAQPEFENRRNRARNLEA
jgi:hypothetical protein